MSRKKYVIYHVAFDDNTPLETESYHEAFAAYQRHPGSATLYGHTGQGDIETILSK